MSAMDFLLQREVIITLAIGGAVIATVGNYLLRGASSTVPPDTARFILRLGYGISFSSIAFFIVAGFMSGY